MHGCDSELACVCVHGSMPAHPSVCHLFCSSSGGGEQAGRMYLSHGCQEALWVEEACHPEAFGLPFKDPSPELSIAIK